LLNWLLMLLVPGLSANGLRLRNNTRMVGDRERGSGVKIGGGGDRGRLKLGSASPKVKEPPYIEPTTTATPDEPSTTTPISSEAGLANYNSPYMPDNAKEVSLDHIKLSYNGGNHCGIEVQATFCGGNNFIYSY